MYLTVAAIASLLVMAFNVNTNSMNVNAIDLDNFQNFDDLGQSAECVIVVVGCDGQGSVGSSGDVNIGVGDNDTTTNGGFDPNTPVPPIDQTDCVVCLNQLTGDQLVSLREELGLFPTATGIDICAALDQVATVGDLVEILDNSGLSPQEIVDFLACLEIDITLADVIAIIDLQ